MNQINKSPLSSRRKTFIKMQKKVIFSLLVAILMIATVGCDKEGGSGKGKILFKNMSIYTVRYVTVWDVSDSKVLVSPPYIDLPRMTGDYTITDVPAGECRLRAGFATIWKEDTSPIVIVKARKTTTVWCHSPDNWKIGDPK